jgi:hypothetical protein
MSGTKPSFVLAVVIGAIAPKLADAAAAQTQKPEAPGYTEPQDPTTLREISGLYRKLIEAENRHDLAGMHTMVWNSPSALFVAKAATPAEGNWAGFWGTDVVVANLGELYKAGPFRIDPDYDKERVVGLSRDVVEPMRR